MNNPLWEQQLQATVVYIRKIAKNDLSRAIKEAETYLRWLGRYSTADRNLEKKRIATIRAISDLVKIMKAKLTRKP